MAESKPFRFSLKEPAHRDIAWAALGFLLVLICLIQLDLVERIFHSTRPFEHLELDEWIAALPALALAAAWYAYRRWQESARLSRTFAEKSAELEVSNRNLSLTIEALDQQIQARRQAEAALSSAKETAERANRDKSAFLAAASHDLRQPLHSMRLLLAALPDAELSKPGREIVSHLNEALETMGGQLNALLDISKLDADAVEPAVVSFRANPLLERLERSMAPLAREKAIQCRFVRRTAVVRSDPDLLYEILQNFLSNAIRHCDGKPVLAGCRRRGSNLRFEVWDRGTGIPKAELKSVFKAFYQVGSPQRDRDRGLGLGLAIVERLARLLGHRLEVSSTPNRGTLFAIEVPLAEQQTVPCKPVERPAAETGRPTRNEVLIVEDNVKVAEATERLLRSWGHRCRVAGGELPAIRMIENDSVRPHLVILDYHLQECTGITALTRIRSCLGYPVPGLIITGHLTPGVLSAAKIEDCVVLQKPIDPDALRRRLDQLSPAVESLATSP